MFNILLRSLKEELGYYGTAEGALEISSGRTSETLNVKVNFKVAVHVRSYILHEEFILTFR